MTATENRIKIQLARAEKLEHVLQIRLILQKNWWLRMQLMGDAEIFEAAKNLSKKRVIKPVVICSFVFISQKYLRKLFYLFHELHFLSLITDGNYY